MRVAVIDAGATALRLLVARGAGTSVERVHEEHRRLPLSAELEAGPEIGPLTLRRLGEAAAAQARRARELGAARLLVVVGSPGRQSANGDELERVLAAATSAPVRVLSGEEEGRLAYAGALAKLRARPRSVTVCDVGGGSTQLVFGTPGGPAWARSVDLGSLRLTHRLLAGDPPPRPRVVAARLEVAAAFAGVAPPRATAALAVGGSARAAARLVGPDLGRRELLRAVQLLSRRTRRDLSPRFRLAPARVETLLAGVLILLEAQRRLGLTLQVVPGGVREGAAAELIAEALAA